MRVLSLFDGISCAKVALERAGIPITTYYAAEIDKHAIQVSEANHPDIQRLGDVRTIQPFEIDLLIGGSPCQDLSIAKRDRKGLEGERSSLFWEQVRLWKDCKPKWFILENVASMPKAAKDLITATLGVEPVLINAALVSAQSRKRLFWTNLPVQGLPEDRGIVLKDILLPETEVDERLVTKSSKAFCLDASYYKGASVEHSAAKKKQTLVKPVKLGQVGEGGANDQGGQAHRVQDPEGKSITLGTSGAALVAVSGRDIGRRLNAEGHREDSNKELPITRRVEVREDGKASTLTNVLKDNLVVEPTRVRKLDPIECERLQGLPDGQTKAVSNTQRYKCLGNAFNVDVIVFLLSFLPKV